MKYICLFAVILLISTDSVLAAQAKDNDGWQVRQLIIKKHSPGKNCKVDRQIARLNTEQDIRIAFSKIDVPDIQRIILSYLTQKNRVIQFIHANGFKPKIFSFWFRHIETQPTFECALSTPISSQYTCEAINLDEFNNPVSHAHVIDKNSPTFLHNLGENWERRGLPMHRVTCGKYQARVLGSNKIQLSFDKDDPNLEQLRKILLGNDAR